MTPERRAREHEALATTCATLGLELPEAALERLSTYLDLLERWNRTYNLTAVRDRDAMRVQHLNDCLAVVGPLRRHLGQSTAARLLDIGSGAGLPGVVLAIAMPDLAVTCCDSVGKKAAFLRQVVGELGLGHALVEHTPARDLVGRCYEVITSRAFATAARTVAESRHLLAASGVWMLMKGGRGVEDASNLPFGTRLFHVEPLRVPELDAARSLIWIDLPREQAQAS